MNKLKRSLALFLTVCMLLSVVPFGALAEEMATEPVVETAAVEETVSDLTAAEETETEAATEEATEAETEAATEAETEAATEAETEPAVEETEAETEPVVEETQTVSVEAEQLNADTAYQYNIVHLDAGRKYFSVESIKTILDNAAAAGFNQLELYLSDNQGFRFALDDMTVTTSYGTYDLTPALGDGYSDGSKYPDYSGKWLTQTEMDEIIAYANSVGIDIVPCINVPGHMGAILEEFTSFKYSGSNSSINLANEEAVAFALALTEKYATYFASKGCKYYNIGADEYANDLSSMGFEGMGQELYTKFVDFMNDAADIVIALGMTPRAFNDGFYYGQYTCEGINTAYEVCYWSSGWTGYSVAAAETIYNKGHKMINTHGDYYWVLGNSSWQCSASKASGFDETVFQGGTIDAPAGAMFCIWCDVANTNGTDGGTAVAADTADVIAAFGAALPTVESLVTESGNKGDGTEGEETVTDVTVPDSATGISVTAPGLTGLTVTVTTAPTIEGADHVLAWDVVPVTAEGNYSASGVVAVPVPEGWNTEKLGAYVVNGDGTVSLLTGTYANGIYTYTSTHFSTTGIYDVAATADTTTDTKEVTLAVGEEKVITLSNVCYEDQTITNDYATVVVDGTEEVKETVSYTATSVSYRNLANSNSSWTKTDYYALVDGTYYPVYAYFSYNNYNYYYGYSTTDSSDDVTQLNSVSYNNRNNTVTVYTKSGVEGTPASTTITITGVKPGTTYATVGETTYKIVVSKKTVETTVYVDATKTFDDKSENYSVSDPTVAKATLENGVLTITGLKAGETTITTEYAVYTVNVSEEDLSTVSGLTVEFWITNQHITANNATSMTISAEDVYSANGVEISTLVPATGTFNSNTCAFWKATRHEEGSEQTTAGADDKTKSGTDFIYIRYYSGSWAYSADRKTWTEVVDGDQIVAYYLQVTEVTDEVTTQVSDYGNVPGYGSSLSPFVMVDYAVKYESGEMSPTSFPTAKTIAFHCNYNSTADLGKTVIQDGSTYYRKLGTIKAIETSEYEVYMITLTPTSDTKTTQVASNATGATSYTYAGTEKVVWVDDEANLGDFASEDLHYTSPSGNITYTVGGEPDIAGLEVYMNQCMLVTYYVRAKATEDSLTVHYIDGTEGANNTEFYSYNIAVQEGTYFHEDIGLNTSDPNGDLLNGTVTNYYGRTQTVSADLKTLSQIGAQYLYTEYNCYQVTRSADGKDVYLYYTFDPTVYFVADFGLPINITATDLSDKLVGVTIKDMLFSGVANTVYGKLTDNGTTVTYAPDEVLTGLDYFTLLVTTEGTVEGILDEAATQIAFRVYIVPATTVYYEESFVSFDENWTSSALPTATQATEILYAKKNNYGYDPAYASNTNKPSNGTYAYTTTLTASGEFTFTGTGFELYANCFNTSGWVTVINEKDAIVGMYMVDTHMEIGESDATAGQEGTFYNIPVVSVKDLAHGTYTVTIRKTKALTSDATAEIQVDGFRVFNTISKDYHSIYVKDLEDNPEYYQLRDLTLGYLGAKDAESQDYAEMVEQVWKAYGTEVTGLITSSNVNYGDEEVLVDLLDNGPKNEIYLRNGESLTFTVETNRCVQIGLKAPQGATTYTVNGTPYNMNSTVDMFYSLVSEKAETATEHTFVIANTGDGILSITDLKICDDPDAAFVPLTAEAIENALKPQPAVKQIIRLAGNTRIETAFAIADELKQTLKVEKFQSIVVACSNNFPDALSGTYLAAQKGAPILLVSNKAIDAVTDYIAKNLASDGMVYILGDEGVVSADFTSALNELNISSSRLAGNTRYDTNLEILKAAELDPTAPVLIATGTNFADSLSASATGLPMVLVGKNLTKAQKEYLATTSKNFIILGDNTAVSDTVEAQLKALGGSVERVAGKTRYDTSVEIAKYFFPDAQSVVLADGATFPDGLCGGVLAAAQKAPLLLTSNTQKKAAAEYLLSAGITSCMVMGGSDVVSDATVMEVLNLPADAVIIEK